MPRKSTKVPRVCEQCGNEFLTHPCYIRRGGGRFCSQRCSSKWLADRNIIGRKHRTEPWLTEGGYVRLPSHGVVYRAEHREVAERMLGRPLCKGEIVHH